MIANLFTVAEPEPTRLRGALAGLLALPDDAVDVADADGDQEARRWDAPVLCTYRVLPPGDLAGELDISVDDGAAAAAEEAATATAAGAATPTGTASGIGTASGVGTEAGLARGLAARTAGSVLHPALDLDLDSAYWVATADGRAVRCRVGTVDDAASSSTAYRVDKVEEKVADLPHAKVEILPEVLEHERIGTPVSDAFLAAYPTGTAASVAGHVRYGLHVWERFVRRLAADRWGPAGRYREDLHQRDLRARADLARLLPEVGGEHAEGLRAALARLDAEYDRWAGRRNIPF